MGHGTSRLERPLSVAFNTLPRGCQGWTWEQQLVPASSATLGALLGHCYAAAVTATFATSCLLVLIRASCRFHIRFSWLSRAFRSTQKRDSRHRARRLRTTPINAGIPLTMAVAVVAPPALSGDLALYHTTDPLLANSPLLIFHGTAATIGATSSRIQVHIFTPAGLGSYSRLAVSPNSPFYSAVSNLPREEQGDEVCRGIAFGLKKYFTELPDGVKKAWQAQSRTPLAALFGDDHIAILATRMTRIENVQEVIDDLAHAFGQQRVPWIDVDVVLPPGAIKEPSKRMDSGGPEQWDDAETQKQRYGQYATLIDALGEPSFLPTSKLRRAPSKASSIGRSASFLKQQKENARKEISELFETEGNYVSRLRELQSLADNIGADLNESGKQQLQEIFPDVLREMTERNLAFFDALRDVLNATEENAMQDIESMPKGEPTAQQARQDLAEDTQGITAIAKCLCDWFPQFAESYAAYMKSHGPAAGLLRSVLRDDNSALSMALHEVGEQQLTSLLIEPVQRLPRYNLYIDSISKQLPARHPALKHLMKARDLVTDICTQEDAESDNVSLTEKLRARVSGWPADTQLTGRLVTAVDAAELAPPYKIESCTTQSLILLIFTDSMLVFERPSSAASTARALLSELDGAHYPRQPAASRPGTPNKLRFVRRVRLSSVELTEALEGQALQVLMYSPMSDFAYPQSDSAVDAQQLLFLEGAYEGKAGRLLEEVTKTRVEGRFSETERESAKWDVRASHIVQDQVSLFSAVFEDSIYDHVAARQGHATTRIVLDLDKHSQRPRAGQQGIRTVIALAPQRDGTCRVSVDSIDGPGSREHVAAPDVVNHICRRLGALLASHYSITQPAMSTCHLSRNADILRSIDLETQPDDELDLQPVPSRENSQRHRPKSPVKMLSSFLSSTGPGSQPPSFLKRDIPAFPSPRMPPPTQPFTATTQKPPSRESRPASKDQPTPRSLKSMQSIEALPGHTKKLEDTLSTYMLALQARKGNIVGRNLKMRATADELAVSDLYNKLLEDPNMMVLAAECSVDVLFCAFEKFVNNAWKEQVGPVVPFAMMQEIQTKAETMFPTDFDAYFRENFSRLASQNQRAFKGIMSLLADLLDGTGNDGDRGILTAAFAELLVTEGNPHDFIALIDRFVEDTDTYFGEPLADLQVPTEGAMSGHKRSRSVNTGSVNSNTSSLRKKFGFGSLSRENSKNEHDSKVSSVWRTLSKSTRGESPAGSISRGTLHRSHSTDIDGRLNARPSSQEGPTARKASGLDDAAALTGPSSAQNLGLSTIGEHPSFIPTGPPRKKRRSSLSDLKALDAVQKSPLYSPPATRRPLLAQNPSLDKSLPASPQPSTPSSKGGSGRFGSPVREPARSRLPSSFRKENSPSPAKALTYVDQRPKTSGKETADEVVITARPTSNIPTLSFKTSSPHRNTISTPSRSGLSERPGLGNIIKKPPPTPEKAGRPPIMTSKSANSATDSPAASRKLRMQSPQKLRERLQNEQAALSSTQTCLQDELSKIGDELTSTPSRIGSVRASKTLTSSRGGTTNISSSTPSTMDLAQRVLKLEARLPEHVSAVNDRIGSIQSDLASSLSVSETKCKKLDELYREANSENEALYARFNDELGRILKAVRGGEGIEELKKKWKESQEEVAKLKRENGRLKRENVGLRSQLRE